MTISIIREKDYEPLKKLFLEERKNTFSWLDQSEFQLDDFEKLTQGEFILTALIDDFPVGFISIWLPNNFIHHLYISRKYQGQNIGTELLKAATKKAAFPITLKCLEKNIKAVDFYKSKGFVEKEKGNSEHGTYILFELLENIN
ncbi:Ribosomal protein S18 acetylase RimI [Flavobacterium resistens]|uniref:GNAT family N-acetyltransferase n=1 Tax=Flavobacterium resistens TaxID=443612 RepID=A0A521DFS9_9FLAO|nr:GNAT family N-acetyltransferase [Flavobacterium resistens]MRX68688.1 GNAT family N-acetyltransferase [Flavobacterium resistens]SMO70644.1 Ribosomal protein S18 acetylase RimI [Flavobacterium resistens]